MQLPACRADKREAVSPPVFLQKQGNAIAEAEGPTGSYDDNPLGFKKTLKAAHRHQIHP
jgi:hypothetical protein